MDSMKLHEMRSEISEIEQEIIDAGGEIFPEQETRLAELGELTEDKLLRYGFKFLDVDKDVDALDVEIKRLQQRKKVIAGGKAWLMERAKEAMEHLGINELKGPLITLKICKNPPSCNITDEDSIPASFITIIPESKQIMKVPLLAALKVKDDTGKTTEIPGAELITDKTRLKIS